MGSPCAVCSSTFTPYGYGFAISVASMSKFFDDNNKIMFIPLISRINLSRFNQFSLQFESSDLIIVHIVSKRGNGGKS